MKKFWTHFWTWVVVVFLLSLVGGFFFYLLCLNHIDVNEIGATYDSRTGAIGVQEESGWYFTSAFVRVEPLSIQPMKVDIPSGAIVNTGMVVRLKKGGVPELVRMQGFSYSLDSSLNDILRGYAYSSVIQGKEYPWLEVMQRPGVESTAPVNK